MTETVRGCIGNVLGQHRVVARVPAPRGCACARLTHADVRIPAPLDDACTAAE